MSDEQPAKEAIDDKDAMKIEGDGLMTSFELEGERCEVHCFFIKDGGVYFKFVRAGRATPIRLSTKGAEAMMELYSEMVYRHRSVP